MRSALTFLLLTACSLFTFPVCSAQTVHPQTGAVCELPPNDLNAVRSEAEAGDAIAEYELGRSMLSPRPKDSDSELTSAMPWFRLSAEQGYAPAEYMYGGIFREGRWKNPQQLVYWWTKAAEHGNVNAQLWLGALSEQGRDGVERNYPEAFKWLSLAAKQGQPDAEFTLGQMYEDGEGVSQDYGLAAYWYRKAADHTVDLGGAGAGVNSLAQLYEHGHATPLDYVYVYVWYARADAADQLHDVAKKMSTSQTADAQSRVKTWASPPEPCP